MTALTTSAAGSGLIARLFSLVTVTTISEGAVCFTVACSRTVSVVIHDTAVVSLLSLRSLWSHWDFLLLSLFPYPFLPSTGPVTLPTVPELR